MQSPSHPRREPINGILDWSDLLPAGAQPIRVLSNNLIASLESTDSQLVSELQDLVAGLGLKPGLAYYIDELPIVRPGPDKRLHCYAASVDGENRVELHETFLSYLWAVSYALLVLYEGNVQRARLSGGRDPIDPILLTRAQHLLRYGLSLVHRYSAWDRVKLPNPTRHSAQEQTYVEKANGIFCQAAALVLLHEIAHVKLGHTALLGTYVPTFELIEQERQCDRWAIDRMRLEHNSTLEPTKMFGVIAGLCSLLLLSKSLLGGDHPDTDERLREGASRLGIPETSQLWGIALQGVVIWGQHYDRTLVWPGEADNFKEVFDHAMDELQRTKYQA